jgi:hypothetical protein
LHHYITTKTNKTNNRTTRDIEIPSKIFVNKWNLFQALCSCTLVLFLCANLLLFIGGYVGIETILSSEQDGV